jgi:putative amino-acid transport system substrate-binding protein
MREMFYLEKLSKSKSAKKLVVALAAMSLLGMLALTAGCGGEKKEPAKAAAASSSSAGKKKIVLGSTGILAKWTQTKEGSKENGGLEGYDIDVWNEIAKRNNFQLEWKVAEFQALFGMLDSGDITTIANEVTTNPQRLEKYVFTDTYAYDGYVFVLKKGITPTGLPWFKGKKVCVEAATNPRLVCEDMNKKDNVGMEIGYLDGQSTLLPAVANGSYDAAFMIKTAAYIGIHDLKMDLQDWDPHYKTLPICYPLKKTKENEELKATINKTLAAMHKDGTLKKLSVKWFGEDVTVDKK